MRMLDKVADDLYQGAPSDCEYDFINWVERRQPATLRKFAAAKGARGSFRTLDEVADELYPGRAVGLPPRLHPLGRAVPARDRAEVRGGGLQRAVPSGGPAEARGDGKVVG